jgi:phosphoglycerol geranylgeranyltransferase
VIETETPHSAFSAEAELEWKARADFVGVQKSSCSKKESVYWTTSYFPVNKKPYFCPYPFTMRNQVYQNIAADHSKGLKKFAVLIDPDEVDAKALNQLVTLGNENHVDYFFVGGSLVIGDYLDTTIKTLKQQTNIPVVIFPGSIQQVNPNADALLFLSLISGRNPELLIGNQVLAAPYVKKSGIEAISTGYILIDGGAPTTVSYISNTNPIPSDKPEIAACTAMAGELLGMKLIYMDAGSGAKRAIPAEVVAAVHKHCDLPIIVGGGIRTPEKAYETCNAGADIVVVGNAIEKDTSLIKEISFAVHSVTV